MHRVQQLNRGDGRFTAPDDWAPAFTGTPKCANLVAPGFPWLGWKQSGVFPIDYNLDGRQDLLVLQPVPGQQGGARVLVSTGKSFVIETPGISLACATVDDAPAATTLDANGDGLVDVVFQCTANGASSFELHTQHGGSLAAAGHGDLLVDVTDGLGALARHVDYKPLTDSTVYTRSTPFIQPIPVVASESIDDGDGGRIEIARHTYAGGTTTTDAEGWLGFKTHTTTDPRTGATRVVTFATDEATYTRAVGSFLGGRTFHPFKGSIVEEVVSVTVGGRLRKTRTTRTPIAVEVIYPSSVRSYFTFERDTVVETTEAGAQLTRVETHRQVNPCGDATLIQEDRGGNARITTTRTLSAQTAASYCDLGAPWLDFLSLESIEDTRDSTVSCATAGAKCARREHKFIAEPDGTGRVRDVIRQPAGTADERRCTRIAHRDGFGNPDVVEVTAGQMGADPCAPITTGAAPTRATLTTFDADGVHVVATTNPMGHTIRRQVHAGLGVVHVETDANGVTTTHQFDGLGRVVRTDRADGTNHYPSNNNTQVTRSASPTTGLAGRCNDEGFGPFPVVEVTTDSAGGESIRCLDRLGRLRRAITKTSAGSYAYVDTSYVASFPDQVFEITRPHAAGGATLQYNKTTVLGPVGPHALTNVVCGSYNAPFCTLFATQPAPRSSPIQSGNPCTRCRSAMSGPLFIWVRSRGPLG